MGQGVAVGDGYVCHLDCGDGFMSGCICQNFPSYTP